MTIDADTYYVGNDMTVRRDVTTTQTISKAWLTVNEVGGVDADATVQKVITTTEVAGTGHIEDAGAGGTATIRFDLSPADTVAIGTRRTPYDIQVKLADGKIATVEKDYIKLKARVTTATS